MREVGSPVISEPTLGMGREEAGQREKLGCGAVSTKASTGELGAGAAPTGGEGARPPHPCRETPQGGT